jgi:uracil-DNA glycosylase family 4
MAPRILHLLKQLGLDPGLVPASNLIFLRSRRENHIKKRQAALANLCWPFHDQVLTQLHPKVILCLGRKAGKYVRRKGATQLMAQFVEENNRRWKSQLFATQSGIRIVVATHPSIANWCAPPTDLSDLVKKALA